MVWPCLAKCHRNSFPSKPFMPKRLGKDQLIRRRRRRRWLDCIKDLGWSRLGLRFNKMQSVLVESKVWRLIWNCTNRKPTKKAGEKK